MNKDNTRRQILKGAGVGIGLAASGISAPAGAAEDKAPGLVCSKISKLLDTDVLVVGGGPAGIGAALGAARTGVKTVLIEAQGFFGGVAAWALGMPINQVRPEGKPRSVVHELLIRKLLAYGEHAVYIGQHQLYCNVEYLKVAVLDALEEAGCQYLVHLTAADTLVEGNRVTGVVASTKKGLAAITAKVVVDCTGDADVAYFAGAETMMETQDRRMPSTLLLGLANVPPEKIRPVSMREVAARARGRYPLIPQSWRPRPVSNCRNFYWVNHTGTRDLGEFDMTDPFERSKAECVSRRQALQMTHAMREFSGGALKDIELVATSPRIAVRETRRVKGVYILTEEDAAKGRTFEDVIAWRSGYLDLMGFRFEDMMIHDVPYRSILPEKIDGLLAAGRCISATHVAAAAGKSMGNCMATGHAAGLAAALSANSRILPRELRVARLQDALRKDGVNLAMGGKKQENISKDRDV